MASLVQDLGILEVVAGDIASFAAGKPVSDTIDGYAVSVQVLASGPVAPFQVISGSFLQILELAFADYAAFSAGAPISIAERVGVSWYGLTIAKPVVAAAASVSAEPAV